MSYKMLCVHPAPGPGRLSAALLWPSSHNYPQAVVTIPVLQTGKLSPREVERSGLRGWLPPGLLSPLLSPRAQALFPPYGSKPHTVEGTRGQRWTQPQPVAQGVTSSSLERPPCRSALASPGRTETPRLCGPRALILEGLVPRGPGGADPVSDPVHGPGDLGRESQKSLASTADSSQGASCSSPWSPPAGPAVLGVPLPGLSAPPGVHSEEAPAAGTGHSLQYRLTRLSTSRLLYSLIS